MEPSEYNRVGITSAEAGYLTLGSWNDIKKGFEIEGYCHDCDDANAISEVVDYFLNLDTRCVTAEVIYKCCGSESIVSFAVLDKELIDRVLTMSHKK